MNPQVCGVCRRERTLYDAYDYNPLQVITRQPVGWYSGDDGEVCPQCMAQMLNQVYDTEQTGSMPCLCTKCTSGSTCDRAANQQVGGGEPDPITSLPDRWMDAADQHTRDGQLGIAEGFRAAADELTQAIRVADRARGGDQ